MAPTLVVPETSEGLQEVLTDHKKVGEFFSETAVKNGDTKRFLDAYAGHYVKGNPDTVAHTREQVQSVLFDMLRDNGAGRKLNLGNTLDKQLNARLGFMGGEGTAAVSKGRGAMYNKLAPGAQFEAATKPEERFASIGEYLRAIQEEARPSSRAGRADLLAKLERVRSFQASFAEEDPGAGGFLVPEVMRSELLQLALEESLVRSRATVIPMSTLRVPIPMVDETSHASSLFGGVVYYWTQESAQLTESQAKFGRIQLEARKLTGFFKTPNELLADAPAFSAWFDARIPAGLAWYEDVAFLTGDGAEKPEGFIGSPAYVTVDRATTNAISYADLVTIYSRVLPTSLKSAVWIASIDSFPQLAQLTGPSNNPGIWLGGWASRDASDAPPMNIFGRPVFFTEKVPATGASGGKAGDISLVDLSYYLIGDRQSVGVASSEHFAFQNDQTAFRIISRVDGRPWMRSALTPHNGGPTLSAYVGTSATHT